MARQAQFALAGRGIFPGDSCFRFRWRSDVYALWHPRVCCCSAVRLALTFGFP